MADDSPQPSPAAKDPAAKDPAARDFLLEEYKSATDSFWKNEQTGETRVNFFLGLVSAVVAGLATLASRNPSVPVETMRPIVAASLFALTAVGVATMARILIRNEATDQYKHARDRIRQIFQKHYDPQRVLRGYDPFQNGGRRFGGLADIVAVINSLLAAGFAGAVLYPAGSPAPSSDEVVLRCAAPVFVFVVTLAGQLAYARRHKWKPTHAGGVVWRRHEGTIEFLLVRPSKKDVPPKTDVPQEWVLPKGHIKIGEWPADAAVREVREETGFAAKPVCLVDRVEFMAEGEKVRANFFLMRELYEGERTEERRPTWFPFTAALGLRTHPETRYLLEEANRKLADYL